jgi:hypothetical protein
MDQLIISFILGLLVGFSLKGRYMYKKGIKEGFEEAARFYKRGE